MNSKKIIPILRTLAFQFATAAEPLARWRFDDSLEGMGAAGELKPVEGRGNLVAQGREGKAVEPAEGGLAYALPDAASAAGTLSFWYRAPQQEKPTKEAFSPPLPILRLGKAKLTLDRGRLVWVGEGEGNREPHERLVAVKGGLKDWRLIELAWTAQEARVFVNGLLVAACKKPAVAPVEPRTFALLDGDFDEMELGKDPAAAGARFEGVIYAEDFEGDAAPERWIRCAMGGNVEAPEKVLGAVGSKWAFGMSKPMAKPCLQVNLPGIVLTENTLICVLLRSAEPKASMVVTSPGNHWVNRNIEPDAWNAVRLTLKDLQAKPGELMNGFAFNHPTGADTVLALDNFAVIRGAKASRPNAPPSLKAEAQGGAVKLSWPAAADEGGVAGYRVYRGDRADFPADEKHEIGRTLDASFTDSGAKGALSLMYKIAAEDYLGQVGAPSAAVPQPRSLCHGSILRLRGRPVEVIQ